VLVNNNGGGIFSFLPIAQDKMIFEHCVAAPHGLSFQKAAELFGLPFTRPKDIPGFIRAYRSAVRKKRSTLIECRTGREANLVQHRALERKTEEMLSRRTANV
jgi:2-succinyl-5-enolpyruvyl-6-hydroxy-3-cyclohexene-1-carboxylate synthase